MKPEARLVKVLSACEKALGARKKRTKLPPLETAILAVLAPGNRDEAAIEAIQALTKEFVDWNEVRVSSWKEIGYILEARGIANPGDKAFTIRKLLEAVFSKLNKMSLDSLLSVKIEEARRTLEQMTDLPDYAAAAVWSANLGQDSVMVTPSLVRAAVRVGLSADDTPAKARKFLEEQVPRKDRFPLQACLGYIAATVCLPTSPICASCPLADQVCVTGMERRRREEELARDAAAREAELAKKAAKEAARPAKPAIKPAAAKPVKPGTPKPAKPGDSAKPAKTETAPKPEKPEAAGKPSPHKPAVKPPPVKKPPAVKKPPVKPPSAGE